MNIPILKDKSNNNYDTISPYIDNGQVYNDCSHVMSIVIHNLKLCDTLPLLSLDSGTFVTINIS